MFNRVGFKWGALIMALFFIILVPLAVLIDRIFANVYTDYVDASVEKAATRAVMQLEKEDKLEPERINLMLSLSDDAIIVFDKNGKFYPARLMSFLSKIPLTRSGENRLKPDKNLIQEAVPKMLLARAFIM